MPEAVRRVRSCGGSVVLICCEDYGDRTRPHITPWYPACRDSGGIRLRAARMPSRALRPCRSALPLARPPSGYQPIVPGPPLNGPVTSLVIQPP